jgi:ribosomal protein L11 methyltransferase
MDWLQVQFAAPAALLPDVERALASLGALSVTLADPGGEPLLEPLPGETPLWETAIVTALLPAATGEPAVSGAIEAALGPTPHLAFSRLAERDWVREFRENLKPMRFGERLWICPEGAPAPDGAVAVVTLDPGLAFGSGAHPTTAMCLAWLAGLDLAGRAILDFGCGSGILGIAALALGARTATGLDIDPQALEATRGNAVRNGCAGRLRIAHPDDEAPATPHDVIVANILAGSLVELAPVLRGHCRAGSRLALSGILASQAELVREGCAPWLDLERRDESEGWVLLTGTPANPVA